VGTSPTEVLEAILRKRLELAGALVLQQSDVIEPDEEMSYGTPIGEAVETFLTHVRVRSPDKPRAAVRYGSVMDHFERLLGRKAYVEALTRADIEEPKTVRSQERGRSKDREFVQPRSVNFEVSVLRTFFNYLIRERELKITNPCAHFKPLRDATAKAYRRAPELSESTTSLPEVYTCQPMVFSSPVSSVLRPPDVACVGGCLRLRRFRVSLSKATPPLV
jgi:hypothetical protein